MTHNFRPAPLAMAAAIAASVAAATVGLAGAAVAQDFFVPGQQRQGQARPPAQRQAAPPPQPADPAPLPEPEEAPLGQIPVPPVPELPPLPRGSAPPAAVIGVIGLQDVMRASVAAQKADRIISERREKLNEDAQKEQLAWRDMQQALARDRAKLSADQVRARERQLQERITKAQREFRDRNRIIQEAAQFAINQVQSSLIAVIRQVADSRGMNLVLHRNQVALNVAEFDISEKVAEELNKVLPSVEVPPDGVSPAIPPAQAGGAPGAPAAAPGAAPAVARPPAAPNR
jgi:Skp family chaperone for outer membrane proteins